MDTKASILGPPRPTYMAKSRWSCERIAEVVAAPLATHFGEKGCNQ